MKRESFLSKAVELFGVARGVRKKYGVQSKSHETMPVKGCECWRCGQQRAAISNGYRGFSTGYKRTP